MVFDLLVFRGNRVLFVGTAGAEPPHSHRIGDGSLFDCRAFLSSMDSLSTDFGVGLRFGWHCLFRHGIWIFQGFSHESGAVGIIRSLVDAASVLCCWIRVISMERLCQYAHHDVSKLLSVLCRGNLQHFLLSAFVYSAQWTVSVFSVLVLQRIALFGAKYLNSVAAQSVSETPAVFTASDSGVAGNDRILSWTLYGHWHHGGYVPSLHSLRFVFQPMAAMDCGETFQTFPVVPKSLMFHPCKEAFSRRFWEILFKIKHNMGRN